MTGFGRDLVHAVRLLARRPVSSAVIIITFALGIGANTALFSVIKAVWIDAVPYGTASRAVQVFVVSDRDARYGPNMPELLDLRADGNSPLEATAAVVRVRGQYRLSPDGRPFAVVAADSSLFRVFPETPLAGRLFDSSDQTENRPVALASHAFWQRELASDPGIVGRTLTLAAEGKSEQITIIGVLPPRFAAFARNGALLRPMRPTDAALDRRGHGNEYVYALVRDDVSLAAAKARLDAIGKQWAIAQGPYFRFTLTAEPVRTVIAGASVERALAALAGLGLMVLLVACANVANLLFADANDRSRELAIRTSLGATRRRLVAQLFTESVVLAVLGTAAALVLVFATRDAFAALVPARVPGTERIGINGTVFMFTLSVALVSSVTAAFWPALRLSRVAAGTLLVSTERAGSRSRATGYLLTVQIAVGVMVVVTGVLLARSFIRLASVDPGFETTNVVLSSTAGTPAGDTAYDALLNAIRSLPMVAAAGAAESVPMGAGRARYTFQANGKPVQVDSRRITPGYLEAMGIRVVRGRGFDAKDVRGAEGAALVNEHAARLILAGGDALGHRLNVQGGITIVGIVSDVRHLGLDRETVPEVYRPIAQNPGGSGFTIAIRAKDDAGGLIDALRGLSEARPYGLALHDIRPAREHIGRSLREPWFRTVLFGVMAGLVMILTVLGVAALAAQAVVRRTREIGVRMAIGSTPSQAVSLLVRQALVPACAGVVLGLVAGWWSTRVVGHFLFGTDPRDVSSFLIAAALMLASAALAAWLPARRAARIDPAIALRID